MNSMKPEHVCILAAALLLCASCYNPWMADILEKRTISFNSNGGSYVSSQSLYKGKRVERPANPAMPGSNFAGWYQDNGAWNYEWDFNAIPQSDLTLYAKWNAVDFTHTHQWGDWEQTTAPTCTAAGEDTRVCSLDPAHKETRAGAAALGHDWGDWTTTKSPTETEDGEEERTCRHDPGHKQTNAIGALGHNHNWGNWEETLAPTCTAKGEETRTCTLNSAHKDYEDIPPLGHDSGQWHITQAATCTATGTRELRCTRDAFVLNTETIAALGHDYQNYTQTTAPTCTAAGIETGTCTHDSTHKDTRAGAAALGHDAGSWHITQAATCEATGTRELRCNRDNVVLTPTETTTIAALGHDYQNWTETTAPTCTTAGVETGTCTRDQSTTTRPKAINPDAHDWGEWSYSGVDETTDGTRTRVCGHNSSHTETETAYATGTAGLAYELIGTTAYRVRKGDVTSGEVHIPAYRLYNGEYLPVTEIGIASDADGNGAFENTAITAITIPAGVTSIGGQYAFRGCTVLTVMTVDADNQYYVMVDAMLYNIAKTILIWAPASTSGNIVIPAGVTSISDRAFSNCAGLTGVTIPDSVTSIGNYAFSRCGLTGVTIPDSVTSISEGAFYECIDLTSITIPGSVTSIGDYAFYGCSGLESVTIPAGVTTIGWAAFEGCHGLTSITIPDSVTSIGDYAFYGCSGLESVTIPAGVTSIGNYAFRGCTGLTTIIIPGSVTSIGTYAFAVCANLTSVIFETGSAIDSFGNLAFGTTGGSNNLRTAYQADGGGAGTYTRDPVESAWTK